MKTKEKNFISAVIYVHNAENEIESFLRNIMEVLEENFEKSEIICVNDHSDDRSASIIREFSSRAHSVSISVLNMSYYHGLETAMNAGVDISIGDFVLEFDTIQQDYDREEIMKVYRRSLEGYDIVSASPQRKARLSSKLFYLFLTRFTDLPYKIDTESFRILSRRVINRVASMNKTVPYRKILFANSGLKMDNIRYAVTGQVTEKRDKKENRYRFELAIDTLILFTQVGYRFSIVMTMLMMLAAAAMLVYSLVVYIAQAPVEGWTTTMLFLSFAFFGLFGILTIIVKYLQILVNLVFKRKRYSFESIEKLTK